MKIKENNLNNSISDYIKRMHDTDSIGELNMLFEKAGDVLSKMFDENYERIKREQ